MIEWHYLPKKIYFTCSVQKFVQSLLGLRQDLWLGLDWTFPAIFYWRDCSAPTSFPGRGQRPRGWLWFAPQICSLETQIQPKIKWTFVTKKTWKMHIFWQFLVIFLPFEAYQWPHSLWGKDRPWQQVAWLAQHQTETWSHIFCPGSLSSFLWLAGRTHAPLSPPPPPKIK